MGGTLQETTDEPVTAGTSGEQPFYAKIAIRSSLAIFIGSVLSGLVAYATRMILARNLTVQEYGLFYAVFSFVSFFLLFRDLGLYTALVKYVAEFRAHKAYDDIKTSIVSVSFVQLIGSGGIALILFFFSDIFAKYYFKDMAASLLLKVFVLYIFFSVFALLLKSVLIGFRSRFFPFFELVKNCFILMGVLVFVFLGLGVFIPLLAQVIAWFIMFWLSFFIITQYNFSFFSHQIVQFKKTLKRMFSFGIPVMLASIGYQVIGQVDTLLLVYLTTIEEVGVYNVVLPAALLFLLFGKSVSNITFPLFSEMWAKAEKTKIIEGITQIYKYSFVLAAPVILFFLFYASLFLQLSFGESYVSGAPAFQVLLIGVLFYIVVMINNDTIAAIGFPKITTYIVAAAAVMNIILNLLFIPLWGIIGAAIATSASYLLMLLATTGWITKKIKVAPPWVLWGKLIIANACFFAVVFLADKLFRLVLFWFRLPLVFIIGAVVYVVLLFGLRILTLQEAKQKFHLLVRVFRKS